MAAKLARLVYRMLRHGMQFLDQGVEFYEAQHRKLQINSLKCGPELGLEEMWLRSPRSAFIDTNLFRTIPRGCSSFIEED